MNEGIGNNTLDTLTAGEVIRLLSLSPLPKEGGFYRQTIKTDHYTAIYYLVTPESFSAFHRLSFDEVWHFYAGDPAMQMQLLPGGTVEIFELGRSPEKGRLPQLLSPAHCWQATRLISGGRWALFGTTMAPPFSADDYQHGDIEQLIRDYPEYEQQIREFI
jgi:predicted cupin superfamily sugar epimerase